jgi:hypothetical protein
MIDYSFSDLMRTCVDYMYTKLFFGKARLIRRPFYHRGRKGFVYGPGLTLGHACRFDSSNQEISLRKGICKIGDLSILMQIICNNRG